ncbi:MAG: hypothetical protein ACK4QW_10440 [Alphaproteobacteria bacterium]
MVARLGIGRTTAQSRRHPGDLRWPARHVALAIAAYLALAWAALMLLVTSLV